LDDVGVVMSSGFWLYLSPSSSVSPHDYTQRQEKSGEELCQSFVFNLICIRKQGMIGTGKTLSSPHLLSKFLFPSLRQERERGKGELTFYVFLSRKELLSQRRGVLMPHKHLVREASSWCKT
jgi:hypothetical protein